MTCQIVFMSEKYIVVVGIIRYRSQGPTRKTETILKYLKQKEFNVGN